MYTSTIDVDLQCSFFNETLCPNDHCPDNISNVTKCAQDLTTTGSEKYCYSLWSNSSETDGVVKIKYKGCLTGHDYECANSTKCVASRFNKGHYFCCCSDDLCNNGVHLLSNIHEHSPQNQAKATEIPGSGSNFIWSMALIPLVLVIIFGMLMVFYFIWRKRKKETVRSKRFNEDEETVPITNQMNGLGNNNCTSLMNGNLCTNMGGRGGGGGGGLVNVNNENSGNRSIQLLEKLSTGRFGSVWKAKMYYFNNKDDEDMSTNEDRRKDFITSDHGDDEKSNNYKIVAVKIFPPHERSSWIIEQLVFKTPQIEHENILRFIGSECRNESNMNVPLFASQCGFWLITEYHELGSLCDYLKSNTVNIDELLKISIGMAAGLNHLHYEIPEGKSSVGGGGDNNINVNINDGGDEVIKYKMKPSIVHRDFKSRNVLLKPDLTPRIADFGLALIFYPNRTPTGLGQVGTRRYMAPEVLEGAINYSQDSLYRIDIYACALVLWELVSRCRYYYKNDDKKDDNVKKSSSKNSDDADADDADDKSGEIGVVNVGDYKLPFEKEVGQNPSLEAMQQIVCQDKKRPIIEKQWLDHPVLKVICETIEECWDQDGEARLSASCILERLTILARNRTQSFTIKEIGGEMKPIWETYFTSSVSAILFTIDCTNPAELGLNVIELLELFHSLSVKSIEPTTLIILTKSDQTGPLSLRDVLVGLLLDDLANFKLLDSSTGVIECSSVTGKSLNDILKWITNCNKIP